MLHGSAPTHVEVELGCDNKRYGCIQARSLVSTLDFCCGQFSMCGCVLQFSCSPSVKQLSEKFMFPIYIMENLLYIPERLGLIS